MSIGANQSFGFESGPATTYSLIEAKWPDTLVVGKPEEVAGKCHKCLGEFDGLNCPEGKNNVKPRKGFWCDRDLYTGFCKPSVRSNVSATKAFSCPPGNCEDGGICRNGHRGVSCAVCNQSFAMTPTGCEVSQPTPKP